MTQQNIPIAIQAEDVAPRARVTAYPPSVVSLLAPHFAGREKKQLGEVFGLSNFGINLTRLAPGAISSLRHAHEKQDEFIYILQGCPTLHTDEGHTQLAPGMCAGFRAGSGNAHQLINQTAEDVVFIEIGDRTQGDEVRYPEHDLRASNSNGAWVFTHKDGSPF